MKLAGKVVAITGAGSGLGRALALEFVRRGCEVALSDLDPDRLDETLALFESASVKVTGRVVDVRDGWAVQGWADWCVEEHGRVNLIVNNAGVASFSSLSEVQQLGWVLDINFWGVLHGTRSFLPYIRQGGPGTVVNVSSMLGLVGGTYLSMYSASKFAVRGFSEALALELAAEGAEVGVTVVYPGSVRTKIGESPEKSAGLRLKAWMADSLLKMSPEYAARIIVDGIEREQSRILVGWESRTSDVMQRLFPGRYPSVMSRSRIRRSFRRRRKRGRRARSRWRS